MHSKKKRKSKSLKVKYELNKEQKDNIKEAFQLFDQDISGTIHTNDLKVALRAFGTEPSKNEIKRLQSMLEFEEKDQENKNQLDYSDFE